MFRFYHFHSLKTVMMVRRSGATYRSALFSSKKNTNHTNVHGFSLFTNMIKNMTTDLTNINQTTINDTKNTNKTPDNKTDGHALDTKHTSYVFGEIQADQASEEDSVDPFAETAVNMLDTIGEKKKHSDKSRQEQQLIPSNFVLGTEAVSGEGAEQKSIDFAAEEQKNKLVEETYKALPLLNQEDVNEINITRARFEKNRHGIQAVQKPTDRRKVRWKPTEWKDGTLTELQLSRMLTLYKLDSHKFNADWLAKEFHVTPQIVNKITRYLQMPLQHWDSEDSVVVSDSTAPSGSTPIVKGDHNLTHEQFAVYLQQLKHVPFVSISMSAKHRFSVSDPDAVEKSEEGSFEARYLNIRTDTAGTS